MGVQHVSEQTKPQPDNVPHNEIGELDMQMSCTSTAQARTPEKAGAGESASVRPACELDLSGGVAATKPRAEEMLVTKPRPEGLDPWQPFSGVKFGSLAAPST